MKRAIIAWLAVAMCAFDCALSPPIIAGEPDVLVISRAALLSETDKDNRQSARMERLSASPMPQKTGCS